MLPRAAFVALFVCRRAVDGLVVDAAAEPQRIDRSYFVCSEVILKFNNRCCRCLEIIGAEIRDAVAQTLRAISQLGKVQVLPFRKQQSSLYVLWVPRADFPVLYNLPVPAGARAICTDHLDQSPPAIYDCSDANRDGMIPRAVNELPQYVEIFP